ncbi:MAG: DUF2330 domain-containing protein [Snowella sp.]|nr:DUF2330 domain-containing protein [Snowella sp.]
MIQMLSLLKKMIPFPLLPHFLKLWLLTLVGLISLTQPAWAFCGFYVAKADTSLYNQASQVIIARDQDRTVLTMANDYQGNAKDFALVVPVPVVLKKEQVHVGDRKIIERLDAFSAPRLVEYFDQNPCEPRYPQTMEAMPAPTAGAGTRGNAMARKADNLGVTIEEKFSVGEYDILILSAKESNGLQTWLIQNDYKIPQGANAVLQPYIKQGLKFFVAKVNLKEYAKNNFQALRPLMMAYESPKFMLPIRLGMLNAKGDQDLIVYLLSPKGATELTNYRTVKVPSDVELPEFVQQEFTGFYKALFKNAYQKSGRNVAFLEYAWNMANCDPCSADPLNFEELKKAGVFWTTGPYDTNVFISRLHVRYSRDKFPEDLQFQNTANQNTFQGRYVMRRPYRGTMNCSAAQNYKQMVKQRQEKEAQTLAQLTGWKIEDIRKRINFLQAESIPWWQNLWPAK